MGASKRSYLEWTQRKNGDVGVTHNGRVATVLRGRKASDFLADIDGGYDQQELMARITGNYKRGDERVAKQHRRDRNP